MGVQAHEHIVIKVYLKKKTVMLLVERFVKKRMVMLNQQRASFLLRGFD